jgi:hypothetical protein
MFDLESAVAQWRRELLALGLAPEVLPELEDHLREEVGRLLRTGLAAPEAFAAALGSLGTPQSLSDEFARAGRPGLRATLCRHRAKVVWCAALGLVLALGINLRRPISYHSEIDLAVAPAAAAMADSGPAARATVGREFILLRSFELAKAIAQRVGPEVVLGRAGEGSDVIAAASVISKGLTAQTREGSNVIRVTFRHPDSALHAAVLRELPKVLAELRHGVPRKTAVTSAPEEEVRSALAEIQPLQPPSPPQRVATTSDSWQLLAAMLAAGVVVGLAWVGIIRLTEVYARPLRRHTGRVLLCGAAGLAVGFAIDAFRPARYQSTARVFLRIAAHSPDSPNADWPRHRAIMEREIALLQSPDFARQVAERVELEVILRWNAGGQDIATATETIRAGLLIQVPAKSSVITVAFRHPDSRLVRPVLRAVISQFMQTPRRQFLSPEVDPVGPLVSNISVLQTPTESFVAPGRSSLLFTATVVAGIVVGFVWAFVRREAPQRLAN